MLIIKLINQLASYLLILFVWLYQYSVGIFLRGQCRYTPSCSAYFILAVKQYGPWRGAAKGACRIIRCHPFCKGGIDFP